MWLICRTLTRWWRSSVSPNWLFSSSAWMLQRTWVTSANCADSEQILWEIICEVRSFVHHQRFRALGVGDVPKKRRTTAEMKTIYWPTEYKYCRETFEWQEALTAEICRTCLALSSESYKISHKRVIAWKSTHDTTDNHKPGSAHIQHVKYLKSEKHQRWCHDEARGYCTRRRHSYVIHQPWSTYDVSMHTQLLRRVLKEKVMTLNLWWRENCFFLFRFTFKANRHASAPKSLTASQAKYISICQMTICLMNVVISTPVVWLLLQP